MIRQVIEILLGRFKGYEATMAYSGLEALEKVRKSPFDCVVSDIKMSKLDGVELCQAIKKIQPKLPVVLITAYGTDKVARKAEQAGAKTIPGMPFDIKLLLKLLSDLHKTQGFIVT